jgi:hypothetical protein
MNASRYLPIGIQDFEDLRWKGFLYVDEPPQSKPCGILSVALV